MTKYGILKHIVIIFHFKYTYSLNANRQLLIYMCVKSSDAILCSFSIKVGIYHLV